MKHGTCPATGKRIYKRAAEAKKACGQVHLRRRLALTVTPQTTYRCEHCNRWHLTSMSPALSRWVSHVKKKVKTP
jgi:hypothetical protein